MKSTRHGAIQRERHEAVKANALPEWYAARRAPEPPAPRRDAQLASQAPTPPVNPFANYESIRTTEITVWREGERYPRFLLPTHVHTYSPRRAYTPRVESN